MGAESLRSPRPRRHLGAVLLVLPAVLTVAFFFGYPVARLLVQSVEAGAIEHIRHIVGDPVYLRVFWQTLRLAGYATAGCVLLGYPVAHFLATAPRRWSAVGFALILLPLWTSVLVRTYAWIILLGRNGIINRALLAAGLVRAPVPFMYSTLGVLIGMIHVLLPLMILPLYGVLRRIDPDLLRAAAGLGASPVRVFRHVYLPLSAPGLFAGSVLIFVLATGFYITPAIMGGGRVLTLAVLVEQQARRNIDFAGTLSGLLLVTTLLIFWAYGRVLRGDRTWY